MRLMRDVKKRDAYFSSAVAYCSAGHETVCFNGMVSGIVAFSPKGAHGFGFDPIFIPTEGDGRTLAEMRIEEKNRLSHRARAFTKLCEWLATPKEEQLS